MKSAWATSFATPSVSQAIQSATGIFRGFTGKSEASKWTNADGKSGFYTFTEFKIDRVLKYSSPTSNEKVGPQSGDTIYLREFGGQNDQYSVQVSGAASFAPGEDIVIFVKEEEGQWNSLPVYPIKGMSLAKISVKNEHLDGALFAFRDQNKDLGVEHGQPILFSHFLKRVEGVEKNPESVEKEEIADDQDSHPAVSPQPQNPAQSAESSTTLATPVTSEDMLVPTASAAYGKYYVGVVVLIAFVYIYLKGKKRTRRKK